METTCKIMKLLMVSDGIIHFHCILIACLWVGLCETLTRFKDVFINVNLKRICFKVLYRAVINSVHKFHVLLVYYTQIT